MRSIAPQARNARMLLKKRPAQGGEIARLHEIGAMPHYSGASPEGVRTSGLPYGDSETAPMVKKPRNDVQNGRGLVAHVNAAKPETPAMDTATTTVLKKLPDRTVSADIRIVSDLRLPNLFCANGGLSTGAFG